MYNIIDITCDGNFLRFSHCDRVVCAIATEIL